MKKNFDEGFVKDFDIFDGLVVLKYFLIYLVGIFFKYIFIDLLVYFGFERNSRLLRIGELFLYLILCYGFLIGLKFYKSFVVNRNYEKLFFRVFKLFFSEIDMIKFLC